MPTFSDHGSVSTKEVSVSSELGILTGRASSLKSLDFTSMTSPLIGSIK
jgi:hypothetical protein